MATYYVAVPGDGGSDSNAGTSAGSPFATPGKAGSVKAAGDNVYIKSGTYTISSATANVAGGRVSDTTGGTDGTAFSNWEGYLTTPGDMAGRALLQVQAGISPSSILSSSAVYTRFAGIDVDGNSQSGVRGILLGGFANVAQLCKVSNCTSGGILCNSTNLVDRCEATACSGSGVAAIDLGQSNGVQGIGFYCSAHGNTTFGFGVGNGTSAVGCLSYGNTGATSDGFQVIRSGHLANCLSYGNGRAGFAFTGNASTLAANCLSYGNTTYGFSADAIKDDTFLLNCAGGGNSSGNYDATKLTRVSGFVALTGNPFTASGSGDFSLNSTAGAGAACRAAGFPGVMPGGLTTGYLDIGGLQHQAAGGGTATTPTAPLQSSGWSYVG